MKIDLKNKKLLFMTFENMDFLLSKSYWKSVMWFYLFSIVTYILFVGLLFCLKMII